MARKKTEGVRILMMQIGKKRKQGDTPSNADRTICSRCARSDAAWTGRQFIRVKHGLCVVSEI